MAEIKRDDNGVPTMTGVLNTDGVTVTRVTANATSHILDVSDGITGSDFGKDLATRDNSGYPVMIIASETDGITATNLYVNSSGQLLIDSN